MKVLRETEFQETGGALTAMAAKNLLPDAPFYVVNGDTYWVDGPSDALRRMADAYDPEKMDAMLLLARTAGACRIPGAGISSGRAMASCAAARSVMSRPISLPGVEIVSPALLAAAPSGPFSMNLLWDQALAAGRLGAIVHDGLWFHLSTPEDLEGADAVLMALEVGNTT